MLDTRKPINFQFLTVNKIDTSFAMLVALINFRFCFCHSPPFRHEHEHVIRRAIQQTRFMWFFVVVAPHSTYNKVGTIARK